MHFCNLGSLHPFVFNIARALPPLRGILDRPRCLDLAATLSVRCPISADMSDQQIRQFVRGELLKRVQVLQQASVVAPTAFVEVAFGVLDFIAYQALAATLPSGDAEDSEDTARLKHRPPPVARPWQETLSQLRLPAGVRGIFGA